MSYLEPNLSLYNIPTKFFDFHGMPYRQFGKSGLKVSAIGLGTWKFGYPETGDGALVDEKLSMEIFDRAWELGITMWDTANRYNLAAGNSERVIGKWLKNNPDKRRDIIVASKIWGGMDGTTPNHWGLSRMNIIDATHASLERLQTDYMDILYFHRPDEPYAPIEESLLAVEDLIREGTIRYFGISNASVETIKNYEKFLNDNAPMRTKLCAVQNGYNVLRGEVAAENVGVLDYCAKTGMSFLAWSPLAQGLLTGRYNDLSRFSEEEKAADKNIQTLLADDALRFKLESLTRIAKEMDVSLVQLTLAYMLRVPGMGSVIPSANTVDQLESNAAVVKIELSDERFNEITEIIK